MAHSSLREGEIAEKIDIPVSTLIAEYDRAEPRFHTFNHPSRRSVAHVANSVLDRIGSMQRVPVEGPDYLRYPGHPVLPGVAYYLGLDVRSAFHWESNTLTLAAYLQLQAKRLRALLDGHLDDALTSTPGLDDLLQSWRSQDDGLLVDRSGNRFGPEAFDG